MGRWFHESYTSLKYPDSLNARALRVVSGMGQCRMEILLNGISLPVSSDVTVAQLLADSGWGDRKVAVEVNGTIVPRSMHSNHALHEGDRVEIVHALGGG